MAEMQHADAATLTGIHNGLLQMAPAIRVRTRWGDRTTYSIKIREAHAVELTRDTEHQITQGASRYRIEFGASLADGMHAHLSRWESDPLRQWRGWDDPVIVERVWAWLRKFQPAAEALLKVDMQLLQMQGGNHE